jgi:MATE family multidrug resistance protein
MISLIASKDVRAFIRLKSRASSNHVSQVFGFIYTDDVSVVKLVSKVMPLVASFQVADGLAGSCGGVLRGQGAFLRSCARKPKLTGALTGRQHLGALFNVVAYYILALPMGISLAFKAGLGLQGLWIGTPNMVFWVGLCLLALAYVCRPSGCPIHRRDRGIRRGVAWN